MHAARRSEKPIGRRARQLVTVETSLAAAISSMYGYSYASGLISGMLCEPIIAEARFLFSSNFVSGAVQRKAKRCKSTIYLQTSAPIQPNGAKECIV